VEHDLGLSRQEIEEDLSLISMVNFGGGTYALHGPRAEREGRCAGDPDIMADTFARPARLSP